MSDYAAFLENRRNIDSRDGFKPIWIPDFLFDFQAALLEWALWKGRAAIFADCGLGKTPIQLAWAENVVRHTNGNVLILAPLAVSTQTVQEGIKFGIGCHKYLNNLNNSRIIVTNYERLHNLNPADFTGVVCDESSILKSFDGAYKRQITEFMRKIRYRLLCTATAAPNDYVELGTSSEALGWLSQSDMLARFFKYDDKPKMARWNQIFVPTWRLKHHAEEAFWRWVCSWARALRRPSDLGFNDTRFALPPLIEKQTLIKSRSIATGMLFDLPAIGLKEQREESRRTIEERCEAVADKTTGTDFALVWCNLNDEGDLLEQIVPGSIQVAGKDSDEAKERYLTAFARGEIRVLITKPKIGAWGLNFQHCNHVISFPTHSYEQYYQGIRRCWRFGQTRPVTVDLITTEGGKLVMKNLQKKSAAADAMFTRMVDLMGQSREVARRAPFATPERIPAWLSQSSK